MAPSDLGSCYLVTVWPLIAGKLVVSNNNISEVSLAESGGNLLKFILSQTPSVTTERIHPTPKEVGDTSRIPSFPNSDVDQYPEKLCQMHAGKQMLQQSLGCYRTSLLWISSS